MTTNNQIKEVLKLKTTKSKVIALCSVAILSFSAGAVGIKNHDAVTSSVTVASYDGGRILASDLYDQLKNNTKGSGLVKNTLILEVFERNYGSKVTQEQVDKKLPEYAYSGLSTIGNKGNSEKEMKDLVKKQLAYEYGMTKHLKVSDKELEQVFKSGWQPDVTAQFLVFSSEADATKAMAELEANKPLNKVSNANKAIGGFPTPAKLSYGSNFIGTEVYKVRTGDKKIIKYKTHDGSGNEVTLYAVFNMVEATAKSDSWKDYQKELSTLVKQQKMSQNSQEVKAIIRSEFKKANVVVNDDYLKKALTDYTG